LNKPGARSEVIHLETTPDADREYRRVVNSWAMYDWANSAFVTVIMAAIFPVHFRALAREAGIGNADATAAWSYTNAGAMLIVAVIGPLLGALADASHRAKFFTGCFAAVGMISAAALGLVSTWWAAVAFFIIGTIGFSGSLVFYDSLLPHIVREGDADRVSARGYALGYLGGGVLLALNLAWFARPSWFFMPDQAFAVRASFVSVALWWALFSVPFFRRVPEPVRQGVSMGRAIAESVRRLGATIRSVRRFRQLALFLVAFWVYNDGIGTVIKMAVAYGDEIGIGQGDLLLALVITQTVGIPCSLLFGPLGRKLGTKRAILLGIGTYLLICPMGFFMRTTAHFYMLSGAVGLVQGGTQALSRSLFATMVPRRRSAEFFGFFSTGEKFAGILGPVLFGMISQLGGSSRWGILSITVFFIIGAVLLLRVDEAEAARVASEEDRG
jgi:MFS transporter, UMF1 family